MPTHTLSFPRTICGQEAWVWLVKRLAVWLAVALVLTLMAIWEAYFGSPDQRWAWSTPNSDQGVVVITGPVR